RPGPTWWAGRASRTDRARRPPGTAHGRRSAHAERRLSAAAPGRSFPGVRCILPRFPAFHSYARDMRNQGCNAANGPLFANGAERVDGRNAGRSTRPMVESIFIRAVGNRARVLLGSAVIRFVTLRH